MNKIKVKFSRVEKIGEDSKSSNWTKKMGIIKYAENIIEKNNKFNEILKSNMTNKMGDMISCGHKKGGRIWRGPTPVYNNICFS